MSGPKTTFDADELQALLDLLERIENADWFGSVPLADHAETDEERKVLAKLREAAKFYMPDKKA